MHNPTKVFATTINSKAFALYELPGYKNQVISKNKVTVTDLGPEQMKTLVPLVPKLSPKKPLSTFKGKALITQKFTDENRSILGERSLVSKQPNHRNS
jgi:hypothetical protein